MTTIVAYEDRCAVLPRLVACACVQKSVVFYFYSCLSLLTCEHRVTKRILHLFYYSISLFLLVHSSFVYVSGSVTVGGRKCHLGVFCARILRNFPQISIFLTCLPFLFIYFVVSILFIDQYVSK